MPVPRTPAEYRDTKRTAAMRKKTRVKKVVLPLGQMPKGRGWEISTGNLDVNVWVRK